MKDIWEKITKILLNVLNILFVFNIKATSYGVLFGALLLSLQNMIALYIKPVREIEWYGFVVFGILVFSLIFSKNKYEDPNIETKLKYIHKMIREGKFSKKEEQEIWRKAIQSITDDQITDNQYLNKSDSNSEVLE